jgi:probable HAF family extracellular repeat protein
MPRTHERDSACPAPQVLQFKPVTWLKGEVRELRTFAGDKNGTALGVNDDGQVVGASGDCAAFNPNLLFPLQAIHALLWEHGTVTDLGNLGGTGHAFGNVALSLNSKGHVVGNSDVTGDAANHAFLWTKETGMQDLGTLPGDFVSAGLGINDSDDIVGVSLDANFNLRAYLRTHGHMYELNKLIPENSALALMVACSINDRGEIIGLAVNKTTGEFHGFLVKPAE